MATSVPGQSGQPGSPFYGNLLPLWANNEYFPMLFSPSAVSNNSRHRLVLRPEFEIEGLSVAEVIAKVLEEVAVPR